MENFLLSQIQVNFFLQSLADWLITIFKGVSLLGDELFYMIVMPLLYWCIDSTIGLRVAAIMLLSNGFVSSFKMLFRSPRPYFLDSKIIAHVHETGFGIPSGHATNAVSVWGMLAYSIKKSWFTALMVFIIFLIGFSRLVLGAHFLLDVLAGWLLGVCILMLFLKFEQPITQWYSKLIFRFKVFIALFSSLLILLPPMAIRWIFSSWEFPVSWAQNAGFPIDPFSLEGSFTVAGTWAGLLIGLAWYSNHFGKFHPEGLFWKRILSFVIGFSGLVIIRSSLDLIFPDTVNSLGLFLRYIRYGFVGFWVTGFAPVIFQKIWFSKQ